MTIGRTPPLPDPYHGEPDEWLNFSNPTGLEAMWRKVQALLGGDGPVAGVVRGSKPDQAKVPVCRLQADALLRRHPPTQ